jgi:folate-binding protein YgfZ
VPSSSTTRSSGAPPDYAAAREGLAHRFRPGVIAVEGPDRAGFLQGQVTQDVRGLSPGEARPAAGLTAKGKLIYFGRLVVHGERILLLLPRDAAAAAAAHLGKYAAFQKASVRDATDDFARVALYGPGAGRVTPPDGAVKLPGEGEIAGEILAPASARGALDRALTDAGSVPVSPATAEALRVEAGRPKLGVDAGEANVPDEVHLEAAISTTKGCYVGQEIVARMRTYGRLPRRLMGFRFPEAPVPAGTVFGNPAKEGHELARVTSVADSPRFGRIGLGIAFRDVVEGTALRVPDASHRVAIVSDLPFS